MANAGVPRQENSLPQSTAVVLHGSLARLISPAVPFDLENAFLFFVAPYNSVLYCWTPGIASLTLCCGISPLLSRRRLYYCTGPRMVPPHLSSKWPPSNPQEIGQHSSHPSHEKSLIWLRGLRDIKYVYFLCNFFREYGGGALCFILLW